MVVCSHVSYEASCENASRENGGILPMGEFYFESDSRLDEDFYVLQSRASFVLKLDHVTAENDGFLTKVKPRQLWLTGLKTR